MSTREVKRIYVSISIETGGEGYDTRIPAIGVLVGDQSGNEKITRQFCSYVKIPDGEDEVPEGFEEENWRSYWKSEGIVKLLQKINEQSKGKNEREMFCEYSEFLRSLEETYPHATVVAKGTAFVLGRLDHKLSRLEEKDRVKFDVDERYIWAEDPLQQMKLIPVSVRTIIANETLLTINWEEHLINRARCMYLTLLKCNRVKLAMEEYAKETPEFASYMKKHVRSV
jgi:hypothetical protein